MKDSAWLLWGVNSENFWIEEGELHLDAVYKILKLVFKLGIDNVFYLLW